MTHTLTLRKIVAGIAIAITLGASITYWLLQPVTCCQFPGNKQWIDYIAALSGPVTGIVAIAVAYFTNRAANRRFEAQIALENRREALTQQHFTEQMIAQKELDKKADERQQDEWGQRTKEKKLELAEFQKQTINALTYELGVLSGSLSEIFDEAGKPENEEKVNEAVRRLFVERPAWNSFKPFVFKMPEPQIRAIALFEPYLQKELSRLHEEGDKLTYRELREIAAKTVQHNNEYTYRLKSPQAPDKTQQAEIRRISVEVTRKQNPKIADFLEGKT